MNLLDHLHDSPWVTWHDTAQLLASRTDDAKREWVCDVARRLALFGGADGEVPGRRDAFAELVGTGERDPHELLDTSTCGLVVRGLWRLLGVRHPALFPPYRAGFAVADVVTIGRQSGGSVRVPKDLGLVCPGSVLRIGGLRSEGESGDYGGFTHVLTVIGVEGARVTSVDGGQREPPIAGRWQTQCAILRERNLEDRKDGLWLVSPKHQGGRMVREMIDCAKLPFGSDASIIVPMTRATSDA